MPYHYSTQLQTSVDKHSVEQNVSPALILYYKYSGPYENVQHSLCYEGELSRLNVQQWVIRSTFIDPCGGIQMSYAIAVIMKHRIGTGKSREYNFLSGKV